MRAESIEQIREHLARGGRVCYCDEEWSEENEEVIRSLVDRGESEEGVYPSRWELVPIEEKPKPDREWLERMAAEEDKCVSVGAGCFDDVCVTCDIGYYLPSGRCDHCDSQKVEQRQAERDFPIDFEKTWEEIKMYPKQQQLYYAALRIAGDLKYLRDQLTQKDIGDNPKLIMLALDSIAIRAEALEEGLLNMHLNKKELEVEVEKHEPCKALYTL